jgi:hypothetical protein
MQTKKTAVAFALGLAAVMTSSAVRAGEIKIKSDQLDISGDIRLRSEHREETGKSNNDRQRFRLRVGMDYTVSDMLKVKTKFASGTGEQTSTNQTFSAESSQKSLWIDQAYIEFKAADWVTLNGGRMKNTLWQAYSSDAIWDTDLNPEGLSENFKLPALGFVKLFGNAQQMVINEKKATSNGTTPDKPQYVFTEQIGATVKAPMDSRLTLAGAYHDWVNERAKSLGGSAAGTNSNTGGVLNNNFGVFEVTGELNAWLPANTPLSLQGTYLKNMAALDPATHTGLLSSTDKLDTGYQLGGIIGKAKEQYSWEAAYFRKYVEADATVADFADSDFPGTNRKGHIFWVAYVPVKNVECKVKYFDTKIITGTEKDKKTLQADVVVKF